jgi:class 3 adenylate cyclase
MLANPTLYHGFDALLASEEARWQAVDRRDSRADGLFYYAVASTGIYCRPICPARRPRRENVSFYPSCDAAERAGFRSCKLCRPRHAAQPRRTATHSVRPLAVLFADMHGFSARAAHMRPDDALALMTAFHARLDAAVAAQGGTVHKRMGDGLMALFGDRLSAPSDAQRAIAAGFAMLTAIEQWNGARQAQGAPAIALGVGIHFGMAAIGAVGGERTIIGDTVNIASRLEGLTRRLGPGMIVSDEAVRTAATRHSLRPLGMVRLPGCGRRRLWGTMAAIEREPERRAAA